VWVLILLSVRFAFGLALEATSLGMVVLDDLPAGVLTPGAALAEHARERDERIQKLKEKGAQMKDAALKRKLIVQRATKAQERKRMEREKTSITSYFRRGRESTTSLEGSDLPWGAKEFVTPRSSPATAIHLVPSDSGGGSSSGSSGGAADPDPEELSITEDDPLGAEIHGNELQALSDSDEASGSEEDPAFCTPPTGKRRRNYDRTRKFQLEWQAKLPWAEGVLTEDGWLHMVKCRPCSAVEGVPKLLASKFDTLLKHEGRRRAVRDQPLKNIKKGDVFVAKDCKHQRNNAIFCARQPCTVLEQINSVGTSLERLKKRVQFALLFTLLTYGRPMVQYEEMQALFSFLKVPSFPRSHWSDSFGWTMSEFMYLQVKDKIRSTIVACNFFALSADEATACDNSSWLSMHISTCEDWV
jgi:hypothetical protein